jgi:hypothetical protein
MIKNWKKFNEDIDDNIWADEESDIMKNDNIFKQREDEDIDDNEDFKEPIGIDNMVEGTDGLVQIFSPLEYDMVDDWNSDETIQNWVKEERVFLKDTKHDEWSIWGIKGDREVKRYINNNYSW